MGKGDQRSKRGKLNRGTYGKSRPKPKRETKTGKQRSAGAAARSSQ